VLLVVAQLAGVLAEDLADEAVGAGPRLLWPRYASELEAAVRLAGSRLSDDEVQLRLSRCVALIIPPDPRMF
jgi:hypothetical protein